MHCVGGPVSVHSLYEVLRSLTLQVFALQKEAQLSDYKFRTITYEQSLFFVNIQLD